MSVDISRANVDLRIEIPTLYIPSSIGAMPVCQRLMPANAHQGRGHVLMYAM